MRKNYVGKPFTRNAKEQEEDAKRIILGALKDAIEDLKIEYPNQRDYLESVLREGELIASKIVRAERKTVNEIIDNRGRGLSLLNDDLLKLNIKGYSFNNEDKFKEEITRHIAFNDSRSDFIKYPMRDIAIKYFYMPVLKDEARRRGINTESRVGKSRRGRNPRVRGRDDIDWWVAIERNNARSTNSMLDYSGNKEDMLDLVMAQVDDYAYNHNDRDLIKSIDRAKTVEDLFKKEGYISKDKEAYSIFDIGDKTFEVLHVTAENFEKLSDIYPDIYDRFKDDFLDEDDDY